MKKRNILIFILIIVVLLTSYNKYYNKTYSDKEYQDITSSNIDDIYYLESLAKTDPKIAEILENRNNYPSVLLKMLAHNLDMTDYVLGYDKYKGKVLSNNIGKVNKGEFPLLLQYDTRWGYGIYENDVIAINGCGPTSLAMVIAGLTGKNNITPYDIAKYSYENGYYDNGTSWSLFTKGVRHYGIIGKEISLSENIMINELESNHPIICSMRKGDFTTTGHIIVIIGLKDNKFIINDPNSKERSHKLWSYETLKSQIKNLWAFETI